MKTQLRVEWTALLAGAVALASVQAMGAVVVSGSQVRAFLGGKTGKLVYTHLDTDNDDKTGRSLRYLDFSEETLVEHTVVDLHTDDTEPRNAMISPDGQWVAYNTYNIGSSWMGNLLYTCRLQTSASPGSNIGDGALPHWWVHPTSGDMYLIYNGRDLDNNGWVGCYYGGGCYPPDASPTYCVRLNSSTMRPAASATQLTGYQMNGGRTRSGAWLFAAGGLPMSIRVAPADVSNATILEEVNLSVDAYNDNDSLDGCNPSTSPHWSDSDVRFLYLDKPHLGYHICDVQGGHRQHIIWAESDNPYLDEPEWSTHSDFATGKASRNNMDPPYDIYIFRLTDHAKLKVIDGNNSFPHLWVEGSNSIGDRPAQRPVNGMGRLGALADGRYVEVHDMAGRLVARGQAGMRAGSPGTGLAAGAFVERTRDRSGAVVGRETVVTR